MLNPLRRPARPRRQRVRVHYQQQSGSDLAFDLLTAGLVAILGVIFVVFFLPLLLRG